MFLLTAMLIGAQTGGTLSAAIATLAGASEVAVATASAVGTVTGAGVGAGVAIGVAETTSEGAEFCV